MSCPNEDKIRAAFKKFDLDGSGEVSCLELCKVFREAFPDITDAEAATKAVDVMGQCDKNQDGSMTLEEFLTAVKASDK